MILAPNPAEPVNQPKRSFRFSLLRLIKTSTFRVSLLFAFAFLLFGTLLLFLLQWELRRTLETQLVEVVEAEYESLSQSYREGNIVSLAAEIENRSASGRAILYLMFSAEGQIFAGNILDVPEDIFFGTGWTEIPFSRLETFEPAKEILSREHTPNTALVRVFTIDDNLKLLIGKDTGELDRLTFAFGRVGRLALWATLVFGLVGGAISARRLLSRIDRLTAAIRAIMDGRISRRLSVSGSGDEIDRLATNVNQMLDRIEQLLQGLHEVSTNIAHELKMPLTRIRNTAEEAARARHLPSDELMAKLGEIERESDSLLGVFEALLLIARIEASSTKADLEPTNISSAAADVVELYAPFAEEEGTSLTYQSEVKKSQAQALANRELLSQALSNLIGNALKYGRQNRAEGTDLPHPHQGGSIVVSLTRNDGYLYISVADRGPGIPESERKRVTTRFQRLERDVALAGNGLGLSLVQAIASYMGGTLALQDNKPGLRAIIGIPAMD